LFGLTESIRCCIFSPCITALRTISVLNEITPIFGKGIIDMQLMSKPAWRRAVASLVAGLFVVAATSLTSAPAHALVPGGGTFDNNTVAVGDALTLTLTPTRDPATGFDTWTYFCNDQHVSDNSDKTQSGWSVAVVIFDQYFANEVGIPSAISQTGAGLYTFSGPGLGDITPDASNAPIAPLTLAFTIPSSVTPGNYYATWGCVSPEFKSVGNLTTDPSAWIKMELSEIVVTAAEPAEPAEPADKKLADTGLAQPLVWSIAGLAGVMLSLGLGMALWRRVRSHSG
jgi:hypothetical protein